MTEKIDLNLMLVFDALMSERSVTRAAAALGLGQPATSAALGRLRDLFDDPLFIRTPVGMEPTVRALGIAVPVAAAIAQLRATLEPPSFHAPSARRAFAISGVDYLGLVALPNLVTRIAREAPGIDLRMRFIEKDAMLASIDSGRIDLAIAVLDDVPKHLAVEKLIEETFVCVTRADHPIADSGLTLDAYVGLSHVLVTQRGDAVGIVDQVLESMGLSRRVAIAVPQVAIVPMLLAGTDLVATIGRRAAERLSASVPLRLYPPPIDLAPWHMDMIWSRRNDADEGLMWLRRQFRDAVAATGLGLSRTD